MVDSEVDQCFDTGHMYLAYLVRRKTSVYLRLCPLCAVTRYVTLRNLVEICRLYLHHDPRHCAPGSTKRWHGKHVRQLVLHWEAPAYQTLPGLTQLGFSVASSDSNPAAPTPPNL